MSYRKPSLNFLAIFLDVRFGRPACIPVGRNVHRTCNFAALTGQTVESSNSEARTRPAQLREAGGLQHSWESLPRRFTKALLGRQTDVAESILSRVQHSPDPPFQLKHYNYLLNGCAKAHNSQFARQVLLIMEGKGIQPNTVSLSCLLRSVVRDGGPEEALQWLKHAWPMHPSPALLHTVLSSCVTAKRRDLVEECFGLIAEGGKGNLFEATGHEGKGHGRVNAEQATQVSEDASGEKGSLRGEEWSKAEPFRASARAALQASTTAREPTSPGSCPQRSDTLLHRRGLGSFSADSRIAAELMRLAGLLQDKPLLDHWWEVYQSRITSSSGNVLSAPPSAAPPVRLSLFCHGARIVALCRMKHRVDLSCAVEALSELSRLAQDENVKWEEEEGGMKAEKRGRKGTAFDEEGGSSRRMIGGKVAEELRAAFNVVINAAATAGPSDTVDVLLSEMRILGLAPDSFTFTALIRAVIRHKGMEEAAKEWKSWVSDHGIIPTRHSFEAMIHGYCAENKPRHALRLLHSLQDRAGGVVEDDSVHSASDQNASHLHPNAAAPEQHPSEAGHCRSSPEVASSTERRTTKRQSTWHPSTHSYNSVVLACVKNGDFPAAVSVLSDMRSAGVKPDSVTFLTLFSLLTEAYQEGEGQGETGGAGGWADAASLAAPASWPLTAGRSSDSNSGFTTEGAWSDHEAEGDENTLGEEAWAPESRGYEDPSKARLEPHCSLLLSLVHALETDMERHGVTHTRQSFSAMIRCLAQRSHFTTAVSRVEEALTAPLDSQGRPRLVDTRTFNSLLTAAAKSNKTDFLEPLLSLMRSHSIPADEWTLCSAVEAAGSACDVALALRCWEDICGSGVQPSTAGYNSLIKAVCRAGDRELALHLLGELSGRTGEDLDRWTAKDVQSSKGPGDSLRSAPFSTCRHASPRPRPDKTTFHTLLAFASQKGDVGLMESLVAQMWAHNIAPDIDTCGYVAATYAKQQRFEEATTSLRVLCAQMLKAAHQVTELGTLKTGHNASCLGNIGTSDFSDDGDYQTMRSFLGQSEHTLMSMQELMRAGIISGDSTAMAVMVARIVEAVDGCGPVLMDDQSSKWSIALLRGTSRHDVDD